MTNFIFQVGWNASVPECIDSEPPTFTNCPTTPIYITVDQNGQLMAADFPVPQAVDNSGTVAWIRVEPAKFRPPHFITKDTDVVYTAYDTAGNAAQCHVLLRLPGKVKFFILSTLLIFLDTQPPLVTCPNSFVIETDEELTETNVAFNTSTVDLRIQDVSNITDITFEPTGAVLKLGKHVTVTVTASDSLGNQNSCKFQVIFRRKWFLKNYF